MSQHLKTEANCSPPRTGFPSLLKSIPSLLSHHPQGCSQPTHLFCGPTRCTALLRVQWRTQTQRGRHVNFSILPNFKGTCASLFNSTPALQQHSVVALSSSKGPGTKGRLLPSLWPPVFTGRPHHSLESWKKAGQNKNLRDSIHR